MNGDFSLINKIFHQDYMATDVARGIELNLEEDKAVVSSFVKDVTI